MICCASRWLHGSASCLRRLRCSHYFKRINQVQEFRRAFQCNYSDTKYIEITKRLAAVPYLKLLEKEADTFRHDFCYEKDDRLIDVQNWFSKVFDHNAIMSGNLCFAVLLKAFCTYGFRMDDSTWDHWDSDQWRATAVLAWCVRLLQASYLLTDDMVDRAVFRKGNPCWHTRPDVGMRAIIDSQFLLSGVLKVLQKHFTGSKIYMNILQEFVQAYHSGVCGQVLDTMYNPQNRKSRMDMFSFEKYQTLVEYKLNSLAFYLPLHLALHLAGECSDKEFEFTRDFSSKIALWFQIQDDYLDCFEKPEITGETANDIPEGRLTFWAVKFLQVASGSMREEFLENYGVGDKDAIATVLELYRKTNLIALYREFQFQLSADIRFLIDSRNDIKGVFFNDLFDEIQKGNFH